MAKKFRTIVHLVFDQDYEESELEYYDNDAEEYEKSTIEWIKEDEWKDRVAYGPVDSVNISVEVVDD